MKKTILILVVIAAIIGITLYSKNNKQLVDTNGIVVENTIPISPEETIPEQESEINEDISKASEEGTLEQEQPESVAGPGSYIDYDDIDIASLEGKIVLDFYAAWCPSCRRLEKDIKANLDSIPSDLTIVKVNYDSERALKQQYGVTRQHTLVQIDQQGNKVSLWTGSPTLESLVGSVQ